MKTAIHARTFTGWVSDLARDHTRALAGMARTEGLNAEDALDAVQEAFVTFLQLPQARALVGAPDDSRALMMAIVRNAARNKRRRHYLSQHHSALDENMALAEAMPNVDDVVAEAEEHIQLQGCVNRLAEIQRRVVTLRMLEEASGTDAATQLDLQPGHVAVLLHRAKKELLRCMAA